MPEAGSAIACGQYHTLVVGASGRAYAFGWSLHGQTGQRSIIDDVFEPTVVQGVEKVTQIAAGFVHSVFLSSDGSIFLCGNGSYGQMGIGEVRKVKLPMRLESVKAVRLIAGGWFHTLALTVDKRLYVWGASPQSLKFKAFMKRKKQQQSQDQQPASGQPMVEKYSEGSMTFADELHLRPTEVEIQQVQGEIVALRAGMHHNLLLTQIGHMYGWGRGMEYQLGFGDKRERTRPTLAVELSERNPMEIACGSEHSMAVDELGLLWGWGRNDCAQLGFHSLDESERNKLSGKRLMIQRGSKPQRTITLPMDSRIFVAKPTRLSGVKAFVATSNRRCFDESNLVTGFRAFSGFYDVDDMIFLCEKYKKPKLKSLLLLLKGRSEEAMELLGDSLAVDELNDQQFCAALFSLMKEFAVDPVEKMKILKPILCRFARNPENAELALATDQDFWYPAIAGLLAVEPESVPLSGEFKLNVLTQVSKSRESQPTFVELDRIAASNMAAEQDEAKIVFCSCKHVIPKDRLAALLVERQIFAGRILSPESRDVLRKCYDGGQIGLCPNCLLMDSAILDSESAFGATGSDSSDILL